MRLVALYCPVCQLALGFLHLAVLDRLGSSAASICSTSRCCDSPSKAAARRKPGRDADGNMGHHPKAHEEDYEKGEAVSHR